MYIVLHPYSISNDKSSKKSNLLNLVSQIVPEPTDSASRTNGGYRPDSSQHILPFPSPRGPPVPGLHWTCFWGAVPLLGCHILELRGCARLLQTGMQLCVHSLLLQTGMQLSVHSRLLQTGMQLSVRSLLLQTFYRQVCNLAT